MTFGRKSLVTGYEELDITEDIIGIGLRFDPYAFDNDLKAIEFKGTTQSFKVSAYDFTVDDTTGWYDLTAPLVGFETEEGYNYDSTLYNIRSIRPILDSTSCRTDLRITDGKSIEANLVYDNVLGGT